MTAAPASLLPVEVELAMEVMPCQANRRTYAPADQPHPCAYFAQWGYYHSFSFAGKGPPPHTGIEPHCEYRGKTALLPEILSGCRKAPIMAVGINPNLPGWWPKTRNALNPMFDEFLQYLSYFRYRNVSKLVVPEGSYRKLLAGRADTPATTRPLTKIGSRIPTERDTLTMYKAYQGLLDALAQRQGWPPGNLTVGEDLSYGNMVACPSAKWLTSKDPKNPSMPVMSTDVERGIVQECFHARQFFLRQLFQSLPTVLLVFSETTAKAFISAMQGNFISGSPAPGQPIPELLAQKIVMRYGRVEGEDLTARVIFTPHASADPAEFAAQREKVIAGLVEEAQAGRLVFNAKTGHLARPRGSCVFCKNLLYSIGPCDYVDELRPLKGPVPEPFAEVMHTPDHVKREKSVQQSLLGRFRARAARHNRRHRRPMSPFGILS